MATDEGPPTRASEGRGSFSGRYVSGAIPALSSSYVEVSQRSWEARRMSAHETHGILAKEYNPHAACRHNDEFPIGDDGKGKDTHKKTG